MDTLTIAYMTIPGEREDWREEMLNDIRSLPYVIRAFDGIPGDVGAARVAAYSQIDTPYVLMIDPDDRIDGNIVKLCLEFLNTNPEYAACAAHEQPTNPDLKYGSRPYIREFDYQRLLHSPMEFHNCCVFKTEVVKQYLQPLGEANLYNFDWALRLCIACNYPVKKFPNLGYLFRRKPNSHHQALNVPASMVPPNGTVDKLIELGLITRERKVTP